MTKPQARFTLQELHHIPVRERARQLWDEDYDIIVDARPVTRMDRNAVEQWLINNVGFYTKVVYA